jgi:4-amino-4-deoxy-L-arabinose transferase-like glycosyltransferase
MIQLGFRTRHSKAYFPQEPSYWGLTLGICCGGGIMFRHGVLLIILLGLDLSFFLWDEKMAEENEKMLSLVNSNSNRNE